MNDWSPDGTQIACTVEIINNASGKNRISYAAVVKNITYTGGMITPGAPVVLAKRNTLSDRGPAFSPNGKRIAFGAWGKSYRATLWIAALPDGQ